MHGTYLITFEVWPFATGKGAAEDQRICGPQVRSFKVKMSDYEEAHATALNIRRGIVSSGHVWKAPLIAIQLLGHDGQPRPVAADDVAR